MTDRSNGQLSFLDVAFRDIGKLKDFAYKAKQLPKNVEESAKKVRPNNETHEISSFNLQGKDTEISATPTKSTSEIISYLNKLGPLDFTTPKILSLSKQFGLTELHLRSLISSVTKFKYGV